jgi:hypothetical protein
LRGAPCPEAYAYAYAATQRAHNAVHAVASGWGQGVFAWRAPPRSICICICSHAACTQRSARSCLGLFSRTAGLNALPYLVDLHIGCLGVILAWGRRCCGRQCSVSSTVASHELFWTCSSCRAPCTFGAANRHGAVSSLSLPSFNLSGLGCS